MTVQDVFSIKGRGSVIAGRIEIGVITVGDEILIRGKSPVKRTVVSGIEVRRKVTDHAKAGDDVGILLKDIGNEDVQQGDILSGSELDFTWSA
jgi:elongation factor Tu